jgi:hypothetical protein
VASSTILARIAVAFVHLDLAVTPGVSRRATACFVETRAAILTACSGVTVALRIVQVVGRFVVSIAVRSLPLGVAQPNAIRIARVVARAGIHRHAVYGTVGAVVAWCTRQVCRGGYECLTLDAGVGIGTSAAVTSLGGVFARPAIQTWRTTASHVGNELAVFAIEPVIILLKCMSLCHKRIIVVYLEYLQKY